MGKVKFRKVVDEPPANELNLLLGVAFILSSFVIFFLSQFSVQEIPKLGIFIMGCAVNMMFLLGSFFIYCWNEERYVYWVKE